MYLCVFQFRTQTSAGKKSQQNFYSHHPLKRMYISATAATETAPYEQQTKK